MGKWVPNSHGEVHAVPDHWIEPRHIGMFRVVQAPEITTRMAMMQTGEADIGSIDFGRLRELESKGLKFITSMSDKDTMTLSAIWPGNLWTDVNAKTRRAQSSPGCPQCIRSRTTLGSAARGRTSAPTRTRTTLTA